MGKMRLSSRSRSSASNSLPVAVVLRWNATDSFSVRPILFRSLGAAADGLPSEQQGFSCGRLGKSMYNYDLTSMVDSCFKEREEDLSEKVSTWFIQ